MVRRDDEAAGTVSDGDIRRTLIGSENVGNIRPAEGLAFVGASRN
jgi:hypothetical protein